MSEGTTFDVQEKTRRIISVTGHKQTFHNVTKVDTGGNWNRFECDEGYVLVNTDNVLCIVIEGPKVR